MKNNESSKKSVRIILSIIVGVILIIGILAFIGTNYVSKEYIYEQTKECNNQREDIQKALSKKLNDTFGIKETIQEIFYSPKLNECVVVTSQYRIMGVMSNYVDKYKYSGNYDCIVYKNGEKIKDYGNIRWEDENCIDKFKNKFQKEVEKLKRWY